MKKRGFPGGTHGGRERERERERLKRGTSEHRTPIWTRPAFSISTRRSPNIQSSTRTDRLTNPITNLNTSLVSVFYKHRTVKDTIAPPADTTIHSPHGPTAVASIHPVSPVPPSLILSGVVRLVWHQGQSTEHRVQNTPSVVDSGGSIGREWSFR